VTGTNAADFVVDPITTSCNLAAGGTLDAGATCTIGVIFTPPTAGARSAKLVFADNTVTNSNTILLNGTGILPTPTLKITAPTAGQSFKSGTPVTLTASVTSTTGAAPTGTVGFSVDGATYGSPVTLSSGIASISVASLTIKGHTFSASYNGDSNYSKAGPVTVSIVVTAIRAATVVSLSPVVDSPGHAAPYRFAIKVAGGSGSVPGGSVQLRDGNKVLSSGWLAEGFLILNAPPLAPGMHALSAAYSGDALHFGAVSPVVLEIVTPGGSRSGPVHQQSP
jgi:Bacterial Ig-like domain (group 3)